VTGSDTHGAINAVWRIESARLIASLARKALRCIINSTECAVLCMGEGMPNKSNRVNVLLDEEHAAKLSRLAARTYVNPGTIARSLLSTALDQADPDPGTVTALLDAIPNAYERAQQGLREARLGQGIRLEDL
jgi:hypothetical protein